MQSSQELITDSNQANTIQIKFIWLGSTIKVFNNIPTNTTFAELTKMISDRVESDNHPCEEKNRIFIENGFKPVFNFRLRHAGRPFYDENEKLSDYSHIFNNEVTFSHDMRLDNGAAAQRRQEQENKILSEFKVEYLTIISQHKSQKVTAEYDLCCNKEASFRDFLAYACNNPNSLTATLLLKSGAIKRNEAIQQKAIPDTSNNANDLTKQLENELALFKSNAWKDLSALMTEASYDDTKRKTFNGNLNLHLNNLEKFAQHDLNQSKTLSAKKLERTILVLKKTRIMFTEISNVDDMLISDKQVAKIRQTILDKYRRETLKLSTGQKILVGIVGIIGAIVGALVLGIPSAYLARYSLFKHSNTYYNKDVFAIHSTVNKINNDIKSSLSARK